ncbi:hypothetical protein ACFV06_07770 [Streptomyces sp. NPDC059618]|uniref:hypothetical protein n=1 Tax=Streptomyces sp. NPDC059618 TaxID=3346887 RepID=UPI00367B8EA5
MSTTRPVPHTPFPSVRAATTAVAGLAAAALALTGCTGGGHGSTPPSPPVHRSPSAAAAPAQESPASDRTRDLPGESVTEAPDLSGIKVVARAVNAHGSAEIDVPGGIGPGPLSIAVNCEGGGTLKVSVDATALSFPVHCTAGKVAGVLNRMDRPHGTRHAHATVTVTAPTGVRWSLAVGR